jgi:predicted transcriptional regulator
MKNIIIYKGNILKYGLNLNFNSVIVLGAINYIFQNKSFSPFDNITDDTGVWYGVSATDIINEVPILKLQKTTCREIVNNLIDLGFIDRHLDCQILSKTFLKPSRNFKKYFETDKSEIIFYQNLCFYFDERLKPIHWLVLDTINKTAKNNFFNDFDFIDYKEVLKIILGLVNSKAHLLRVIKQLYEFGYIEKNGKGYYKAGAKFLEYKKLKNKERGF